MADIHVWHDPETDEVLGVGRTAPLINNNNNSKHLSKDDDDDDSNNANRRNKRSRPSQSATDDNVEPSVDERKRELLRSTLAELGAFDDDDDEDDDYDDDDDDDDIEQDDNRRYYHRRQQQQQQQQQLRPHQAIRYPIAVGQRGIIVSSAPSAKTSSTTTTTTAASRIAPQEVRLRSAAGYNDHINIVALDNANSGGSNGSRSRRGLEAAGRKEAFAAAGDDDDNDDDEETRLDENLRLLSRYTTTNPTGSLPYLQDLGLRKQEIERAGFKWADLQKYLSRLSIPHDRAKFRELVLQQSKQERINFITKLLRQWQDDSSQDPYGPQWVDARLAELNNVRQHPRYVFATLVASQLNRPVATLLIGHDQVASSIPAVREQLERERHKLQSLNSLLETQTMARKDARDRLLDAQNKSAAFFQKSYHDAGLDLVSLSTLFNKLYDNLETAHYTPVLLKVYKGEEYGDTKQKDAIPKLDTIENPTPKLFLIIRALYDPHLFPNITSKLEQTFQELSGKKASDFVRGRSEDVLEEYHKLNLLPNSLSGQLIRATALLAGGLAGASNNRDIPQSAFTLISRTIRDEAKQLYDGTQGVPDLKVAKVAKLSDNDADIYYYIQPFCPYLEYKANIGTKIAPIAHAISETMKQLAAERLAHLGFHETSTWDNIQLTISQDRESSGFITSLIERVSRLDIAEDETEDKDGAKKKEEEAAAAASAGGGAASEPVEGESKSSAQKARERADYKESIVSLQNLLTSLRQGVNLREMAAKIANWCLKAPSELTKRWQDSYKLAEFIGKLHKMTEIWELTITVDIRMAFLIVLIRYQFVRLFLLELDVALLRILSIRADKLDADVEETKERKERLVQKLENQPTTAEGIAWALAPEHSQVIGFSDELNGAIQLAANWVRTVIRRDVVGRLKVETALWCAPPTEKLGGEHVASPWQITFARIVAHHIKKARRSTPGTYSSALDYQQLQAEEGELIRETQRFIPKTINGINWLVKEDDNVTNVWW